MGKNLKRELKKDRKRDRYLKEMRQIMMREEENEAPLSHRFLESKERVKKCRRPRSNPSLTASGTKGRKGRKCQEEESKAEGRSGSD